MKNQSTVVVRGYAVLLAVALGLFSKVAEADLYVAPDGNDNSAGTKAAPFQTLARAQAAVRALQPLSAPVTVWVRGGTYYLTSPLTFSPADSGSEKGPITYAAYPNEAVTLSGGVKLTPTWSTYAANSNVKVATIGTGYDFDMLFLGEDKPLTLARYPNYDPKAVPLQGCGNIAQRVATWKNPTGGFIRAMHKNGWGGESFKITGKKGTSLDLAWVGDNNRGQEANPDRQVAENIFEELDAPGEWFYDKAAGKLYVYPPSDRNLAQGPLVGATQEELIRVVGTGTNRVKHLTFSGFTFTHTHRTLFTSAYEGLSQGDWAVARKGAVYLQESENITVKDCDFPNIGGNGVFMSGHNRDNTVTGCDFVHIGATAVAVVGLPNATQYYCTWQNHRQRPTNFTPGPASENYPKNITVSYCYVYDNGLFEKQTAGILISISQGVTVSHCTFYHGPRSGINIEDGTFGGHVIEYNDVFDEVRETSDHGPFNSWGRDRWWARLDNGDEARKYALLDVMEPITIRNNRFHNPKGRHSYGIDLDDGSSNYQVSNNLLVNCGFKSQLGFNHTFTNNILVDALATFHQWVLPDMQKTVAHNIIINKSPYYCRSRDFRPNTGTVDYNLFWNRGAPVNFQIDTRGDKALTTQPRWEQYKLDEHSVTADPQFVAPEKGDYTVKAGSPALALGFKNIPMDQFGKPGYPVPPGFQVTKAHTPVRRYATPQLLTSQQVSEDAGRVDLGPLDIP